jgi:hypothetical protein
MPINRYRLTDLKGNCPEPLFLQIMEAVLVEIEKAEARERPSSAG